MTVPKGACAHCRGSGRCAQWCCRVFGNGRRVPAPGNSGGMMVIRICMICQGAGTPKTVAGRPAGY